MKSRNTISPTPWSFEYSPYSLQDGSELPAFELFDADGSKILDTNEDSPAELQEANARLAVAAPRLHKALRDCLNLLADYDEHDGEEGDVYRAGVSVLAMCPDFQEGE